MSLYLYYGLTVTDILRAETIRCPSLFNSKLHRTLNTNCLLNLISPHSYFKIKVYFKKPKKTLPLIFVKNKLDAQFFFLYLFIPILYMFRATKCSSSRESIVSIRPPVYVTLCRWPCGMQAIRYTVSKHKKIPVISYDVLNLIHSTSGIVTNIAIPWLKIAKFVSH